MLARKVLSNLQNGLKLFTTITPLLLLALAHENIISIKI